MDQNGRGGRQSQVKTVSNRGKQLANIFMKGRWNCHVRGEASHVIPELTLRPFVRAKPRTGHCTIVIDYLVIRTARFDETRTPRERKGPTSALCARSRTLIPSVSNQSETKRFQSTALLLIASACICTSLRLQSLSRIKAKALRSVSLAMPF